MSLLTMFGGVDKNAYDGFDGIANKQFNLADDYRRRADNYFSGAAGTDLYDRNNRLSGGMFGAAWNNLMRTMNSKGVNSFSLARQGSNEYAAKALDEATNANLGAWGTIQDAGFKMLNQAGNQDQLGVQSYDRFSQGRQQQYDNRNRFAGQIMTGIVGGGTSLISPGGLLGRALPGISGTDSIIPNFGSTIQNTISSANQYAGKRFNIRTGKWE